jgi:hypothetical protein
MLPKSFSSSEIFTTLQPNKHALMPYSPLGQRMLLHAGVPMPQKDGPLHKIGQQF